MVGVVAANPWILFLTKVVRQYILAVRVAVRAELLLLEWKAAPFQQIAV